MYTDATKVTHNFVKREDQLIELVKLLEDNPTRFLKHVVKEDDGTIQCIMYVDTTIGTHYARKELFEVYSKDVTWGVCDSASGLHKLSTIAALTPDKRLRPLAFTLLANETKDNFLHEISFFLQNYPWLELQHRRSSWFVDGDDQNIHAIEHLMPMAVITLCLYHLAGTPLILFTLRTLLLTTDRKLL